MTGFKVGDRAGIGCFVRACRECRQCQKSTDQYCHKMVRFLAHDVRAPAPASPSTLLFMLLLQSRTAREQLGRGAYPLSCVCNYWDA